MNDYYPDDDFEFVEDDQGYGFCDACGSALVNAGAASDGDGDLYDSIECPCCGEGGYHANERWFDDEGNSFDSFDEMNAYGHFDNDDATLLYPPEDTDDE